MTASMHAQIKELNAKMRQMAEEKRALKADRDRLEQIMQSGGAQVSSMLIQPSPAQVLK